MATIIDDIRRCASEYEMSTGIKPRRVYLGRGEMRALRQWAYDAGYIAEPWKTAPEGAARPEVLGLTVYEANDDGQHMRCCA